MKNKIAFILATVVLGGSIQLAALGVAAADCAPLPTQSQASLKLTVKKAARYRLWLRQTAQESGTNDVLVVVDTSCGSAVAKNTQKGSFAWSGEDTKKQPLLFTLAAGEHTIVLAGDQTTIGVDAGLLTASLDCIPTGTGQNCQLGPSTKVIAPTPTVPNKTIYRILAITAAVVLAAILVFLVWHYTAFFRKKVLPSLGIGYIPIHHRAKHAFSITTAKQYFEHHHLLVAVCGIVIAVLIALLTWGLASAQTDTKGSFELESATLQGGAKVVSNPLASAGAYVLLGETAAAAPNTPPAVAAPKSSPKPSSNTGGGTSQTAVCPAFPSFPDENCTGWKHTGVTLHDCTGQTDNGYIWDDAAVKSFDSCYFSKTLTIEAANVTIKRSQVHGTISTHWSHNYDFRNLTLEDVEIEQEGNADADQAAIGGHNYSCLRCNVHHTGSGIHIGNNAIIQDSYTHDFNYTQDAHGAGIGAGQGNGNNAKVIHNNIQCNRLPGQPTICSSALSLYDEPTIDNVTVKNNLFNTTGGYCVYGGGTNGTNIKFIDNYFGKKFNPDCAVYGPVAVFYSGNTGNVWTGNRWQDGSGEVGPSN